MSNAKMPYWNEELYDLLEFFYWEPQHIGKQKSTKTTYKNWDNVATHLQKIEVMLNYHFALFFNLISSQNKQLILSELFQKKIQDDLYISSSNTRIFERKIANFTQPDLLFEGKSNMVYIEMKINSKSNCEQLLKYLILHILYEEITGTKKRAHLLFLGKKSLKDFFDNNIDSIEQLKKRLSEFEVPSKLKKTKFDINSYKRKALELLHEINIVFVNYSDVYKTITNTLKQIQSETEINVFLGMLNELEKRNLV